MTTIEEAHSATPFRALEPTRRLVRVAPATPGTWGAAIHSDPFALPEQSPEWMRAICASGKFVDVSRAYTFSNDSTVVVPLVRSRHFSGGSLWSPPPAWGVGGIVGPDIDATMVADVVEDLRNIRAARVAVRIDARHEDLWNQSAKPGDILIPRRSHIVDLAETPEQHLARLSKSVRYDIRRAERNGVHVRVDRTGELLDVHYELYLMSIRRWAAKQNEPAALALFRAKRRDPIDKLRTMQAALGDRFLTIVTYVDGRPASSGIVLLGRTTRYTRGAMNVELAGRVKANYALQWRAIEEAYAFGSRRYHMGESGESDGISRFKERFGAVPVDHHEYRFEHVPITKTTDVARNAVKRIIRFKD